MRTTTSLGLLWAKTNAAGSPHSLVGHLLDTAAVAELLWDDFLSTSTQRELETAGDGRGRDLFVLLCLWHDLGKATPAFQIKAPELMAGLKPYLTTPRDERRARDSRHPDASAIIAAEVFKAHGVQGARWVGPILAGHHGTIGIDPTKGRRPSWHGDATWSQWQHELSETLAERTGIALDGWQLTQPSPGVQLSLGGLVSMADWIASSDLFPGLGLVDVTMDEARGRARTAWQRLGLRTGYPADRLMHDAAGFERRFFAPRPLQQLTCEAASSGTLPGLLVVEAPMGEGKTEAALAAAEILMRRSGRHGLLFAMPTQGTTDAMYDRVARWSLTIDGDVPVSLLHGKAMLNEHFREALECVPVGEVYDDFGLPDDFGCSQPTTATRAPAPSSWVTGRHRGLLSPVVVTTVDQVLWAATRTKYVSMRHAGLADKVLVIDEVHSYDVYMGTFLKELLRWCALEGVPTVLMSATLPPAIRDELVAAWLGDEPAAMSRPAGGYPRVTVVTADGQITEHECSPHQPDRAVHVSVLPTSDPEDVTPIVTAVSEDIAEGGCALVVVNTVGRAQAIHEALRDAGVPSLLIHGRLTAAERARRTAEALRLLGPGGDRPDRLVVVGTQITEQSFDVDADVLYTDVAPLDLLLQRIGRLQRHRANDADRPSRLREPRVVVTGLTSTDELPRWAAAFAALPGEPVDVTDIRTVYRTLPLLAAAHAVLANPTWSIPSQVPSLVSEAYSHQWTGPSSWFDAVSRARGSLADEAALRADKAANFLLLGEWRSLDDDLLWKLHQGHTEGQDDGRPVVRDGADTVEVSLVVRTSSGFETLSGRPLGERGERVADTAVAREVLGDSVRLRAQDRRVRALGPLPQWAGDRLLGTMPVLVLDPGLHSADLAVRYDRELGLVKARAET